MRQTLGFVILAIASAPALADIAPSPPPRGNGLADGLVVVALLAIAAFGVMRRKRAR